MADNAGPLKDVEKESSVRASPAKPWQLFRFATPLDWMIMLVGGLCAAGQGSLMPVMAVILGDSVAASASIAGGSVSDAMNDVVANFGYFSIAMAVLGGCWQACWLYTAGRQAARLRKAYFEAVLYQDIPWFDVNDPAELPTRMAAEVQTIQEAIGTKFGMIFVCLAQFVGGLCVAFTRGDEGWKLTLVICTAIPLFALSGVYFAVVMGAATSDKQEAYGKAGAIAEEVLMAMRTVASFGGERREVDRYCKQLTPAKRRGITTGFHMGASFGMIMAAFAWTYALAFWYAVNELTADGADVILVFFAVIIGVMSLNDLGDPMVKLSAGMASGGRILKAINEKPVIETGRGARNGVGPKAEEQGLGLIHQIAFDNVHFSYPSRPDVPILKGLSLLIAKGQKVALVGESGSGKSTAIQLLERFYDPAQGSVSVHFQTMQRLLRDVPLEWWRKQIGYVGQEPVLFAMSVEENIRGKDSSITREEVVKAARQARAYEFLSALPQKLDTYVGVGGGQMSGGQKQRIAIARALVKRPQILLLDEATSALDNESEKQVQATIDGLQESNDGLTTVSIAHRLSTIKNCTNIYFLKMGVVSEHGSHEELMAKGGEYFKLVKTQTSAAEDEGQTYDTVADLPESVALQRQNSPESTGVGGDPKAKKPDGGGEGGPRADKSEKEVEEERLKKLKEEKYSPPLGRLLRMSKPEWWAFPVALLGPLMAGGGLPAMGYLLSQAIADFYIPVRDERIDAINTWAMLFFLVGISQWAGEILKWAVFAFIQESLALRIRTVSFMALVTQDIGFFDDPANKPLGLTTLLESQAKQVTGLTGISCGNAVGSLMGLVAGLTLAFLGSWKLTLACLAAMPVVGVAITIVMMVQLGIDGGSGGGYSVAGSISGEAILNIRTVRALSAEDQSMEAFSKVVDDVSAKLDGILAAVKKGVAYGFGNSMQFIIYILGFWYGAKLIDDGEIDQGEMYQSMFCVMFGLFGAGMAMAFAPEAAKGKLAAYDVFKLLDRQSKVDAVNPKGKNIQDMGDGSIAFQAVTFHYPHRPELPVLKGLDFSVAKGQTVAFVGPSGSGKSTVIQLLQRFYDPSSGSVLVGGVPLTSLDIAWWRKQVALVGQEPVLFDMSLEENVKYAKPDATREEVEAAARKANMDYVFNGKMKWADSVGMRGGKLSGGQKQRCAIARAILRDPTVLLLDEATSALDSVSEKEVQKALDAARAGRTTFTIAHRLSTIHDSDVIMVINQGRLAEQGTHQELLSKQGLYFTLAKKGSE